MGPFEAVIDFKNKKKKVAGPENITFFFAEGVRVPSLRAEVVCSSVRWLLVVGSGGRWWQMMVIGGAR